jgi:hypothetical protein
MRLSMSVSGVVKVMLASAGDIQTSSWGENKGGVDRQAYVQESNTGDEAWVAPKQDIAHR